MSIRHLCLFLLIAPLNAQAESEIITADAYRTFKFPYSCNIEISESANSQKSVFKVYLKGDLGLAVQKEPTKARGRKLLVKSDELWIFTPSIKRPIRIGLDQKLSGEVSNGDILRTNFAEDYTAVVNNSGTEIILKLAKKKIGATYAKIDYFIALKSFEPKKAMFFAPSGKLLKTATYAKPNRVLNQNFIDTIQVQDSVTANKSVIKYSNCKRENIDDSFFNKDSIADQADDNY